MTLTRIMKRRLLLLLLASVAVFAGCWLWWINGRSSLEVAMPSETPTPAAAYSAALPQVAPAAVVGSAAPTPSAPSVSTAPAFSAILPRNEIEATQQMVLAHASLLDPRVAAPDSAENRMILQTMVSKAITAGVKPAPR